VATGYRDGLPSQRRSSRSAWSQSSSGVPGDGRPRAIQIAWARAEMSVCDAARAADGAAAAAGAAADAGAPSPSARLVRGALPDADFLLFFFDMGASAAWDFGGTSPSESGIEEARRFGFEFRAMRGAAGGLPPAA